MSEQFKKEAERIEEDSLYSCKGHFYAAQRWSNLHLSLGIPAAAMAAIAGASALSEFSNHSIIAGILSIIVASLTAVATFINPNEKARAHQAAGNKYNSLKNRARIFYEIEMQNNQDHSRLVDQLKALDEQRSKLNEEAPQIPKWAYNKAKKGIKEGEADYKADR